MNRIECEKCGNKTYLPLELIGSVALQEKLKTVEAESLRMAKLLSSQTDKYILTEQKFHALERIAREGSKCDGYYCGKPHKCYRCKAVDKIDKLMK